MTKYYDVNGIYTENYRLWRKKDIVDYARDIVMEGESIEVKIKGIKTTLIELFDIREVGENEYTGEYCGINNTNIVVTGIVTFFNNKVIDDKRVCYDNSKKN